MCSVGSSQEYDLPLGCFIIKEIKYSQIISIGKE